MLTIENQKYLIHLAHRFSTDAIRAIKRSDYAKSVKNVKDTDVKNLIKSDIDNFFDIVTEDNYEKYCYLDTAARDEFMDILVELFSFIDAETLWYLSDIVLRAISANNRASQTIYNEKAITALQEENIKLKEINSMLIRYAKQINPDIDK